MRVSFFFGNPDRTIVFADRMTVFPDRTVNIPDRTWLVFWKLGCLNKAGIGKSKIARKKGYSHDKHCGTNKR